MKNMKSILENIFRTHKCTKETKINRNSIMFRDIMTAYLESNPSTLHDFTEANYDQFRVVFREMARSKADRPGREALKKSYQAIGEIVYDALELHVMANIPLHEPRYSDQQTAQMFKFIKK